MPSSASDKIDVSRPSHDQVRQQLARILSNPELGLSRRSRCFLEYIVNETLAGRRDYLKAFTIAQDVFGRNAHFDAQNDPCVRVEAGRIRRQLERYYLVDGAEDPILIGVPKGRYTPTFQFVRNVSLIPAGSGHNPPVSSEIVTNQTVAPTLGKQQRVERWHWQLIALIAVITVTVLAAFMLAQFASAHRSLRPISATQGRSVIIVTGFDTRSEQPAVEDISRGLTDEIVVHLVRHKDLIVKIDKATPFTEDTPSAASYTLEGSMMLEQQKLRTAARLVRRTDGAILWAKNYDFDLGERSPLDIQSAVAADIAIAVAQPGRGGGGESRE